METNARIGCAANMRARTNSDANQILHIYICEYNACRCGLRAVGHGQLLWREINKLRHHFTIQTKPNIINIG